MRPATILSLFAALVVVGASAVHAGDYNRFGKGALSIGATPPGVSQTYSNGSYYARGTVIAPAPVVATAPATNGRRAFSAEPAAPAATAPAANPASAAGHCGCCR